VEEIAAQRSGEPPSPLQGVTNELLKIIPAFREQPGRLLVCATNFIRALDSAFLRHGRFDYVIPIGLPDVHAREAMWQRFIPASVVDSVDVDLLVSRTEGFSPADIEYAARSASQRALEKAVYDVGSSSGASGGSAPASDARKGPVTQDYLDAIAETRTTVSEEVHQDFLEDIDVLGRV
jgi:SpoVK/Ycf46/Vps4 family AAA+-type ATPase